VRCAGCGRGIGAVPGEKPVASISGGIMGDEYTESYYFCAGCGVYTVEVVHDRFSGEESVFSRGPVEKAEGDARVRLIGRCPEPWNKKCRCPAHQEYFGDALD
jgi:hypothetical protein